MLCTRNHTRNANNQIPQGGIPFSTGCGSPTGSLSVLYLRLSAAAAAIGDVRGLDTCFTSKRH
jgi:hypothetical protein